MDGIGVTTDVEVLKGNEFGKELINDCTIISQKGIYCYDAYDGKNHINNYIKITNPINPINIKQLPIKVKNIIKNYMIPEIEFKIDNIINVKNARMFIYYIIGFT